MHLEDVTANAVDIHSSALTPPGSSTHPSPRCLNEFKLILCNTKGKAKRLLCWNWSRASCTENTSQLGRSQVRTRPIVRAEAVEPLEPARDGAPSRPAHAVEVHPLRLLCRVVAVAHAPRACHQELAAALREAGRAISREAGTRNSIYSAIPVNTHALHLQGLCAVHRYRFHRVLLIAHVCNHAVKEHSDPLSES